MSGDGAFSECKRTRQSARRTERDVTKEKSSFCWLCRLDGENVAHAIAAKVWESSESDPRIELVVDMEKLTVEVSLRGIVAACETERRAYMSSGPLRQS